VINAAALRATMRSLSAPFSNDSELLEYLTFATGPDWIHEINSYRLIVQREGKRVRLYDSPERITILNEHSATMTAGECRGAIHQSQRNRL
jgi:hypothetical protein